MSRRKRKAGPGAAMLDLWRPPQRAGEPLGCLATTFNFAPGLFDEQCLARFLEIESEPDRESLAFLLEREHRLDGIYAGVLADYRHAGVEHSLRWDVLPVRIRAGKQHAKVSLLAWSSHVRLIVASANLTEQGYRTNQEVAATLDFKPEEADHALLGDALAFLRRLVDLVPGAVEGVPEVARARAFVINVEKRVGAWKAARDRGPVRRKLVFTAPGAGAGSRASGSLKDAIDACRKRGGLPARVRVASPFFDTDDGAAAVTSALASSMARGQSREICFSLVSVPSEEKSAPVRLAAPKSILTSARNASIVIEMLPTLDSDKNLRVWHAKMLLLENDSYTALLVGSANFTMAGMGVNGRHNAEANMLIVADSVYMGRDTRNLRDVWPETTRVEDPESAEWLGALDTDEEEEAAPGQAVPLGFVSATYMAGDERRVVLRLLPEELPAEWAAVAAGQHPVELANSDMWVAAGRPDVLRLPWSPVEPPEKLVVRWDGQEAALPLNVEDSRELPAPQHIREMSAEDLLNVLAAADPSAAFRTWSRRHGTESILDPDLDSTVPSDLDPLRLYDLQATFLHRIRRRARVMGGLRAFIERPAPSRQSLEWRLRGMIGVQALADRFVRDLATSNGAADEALLTLADFLIVLGEVNYTGAEGSVPAAEFRRIYEEFLADLAGELEAQVATHHERLAPEVRGFWKRVVMQCAG